MMAAAATPQQPAAQRSETMVGCQYDFNGWFGLDGRLDAELVGKSPHALEAILWRMSVPEEAWPVISDDYSTEVKFLCYSVKKQGHTHMKSLSCFPGRLSWRRGQA